jgi:hypothetical protein
MHASAICYIKAILIPKQLLEHEKLKILSVFYLQTSKSPEIKGKF